MTLAVTCLLAGFAALQSKNSAAQDSSAGAQSNSGAAQSSPAPKPCSVIPDPDPCGTTPKPAGSQTTPSATDRFPFPGESTTPSAPGLGIGAPTAPDAPAASPTDAAKKFPFPGESSDKTPDSPDLPAAPTAGAPTSSSSSSSSSDDAAGDLPGDSPDLKDAGSEGSATPHGGHILHRAAPVVKTQTADERESEDLRVANYNLDSGNVQGAYLRAKDAVKTAPDDFEAHFALAETAARLGKKDEAIAEYNACLQLNPSDERKKDSDKALARLSK